MDRACVLIVDDDVALADALARALGRGYKTLVAHRGAEALRLVADHDVDLILLDLNLPDLDGIDVAERLADHPADIIMLTARSDVPSRVRGLYAGAADYVSKPFDMDELLARVFARLRRHSRSAVLRWGPLEYSLEDRTCSVDGVVLELTATELELLGLLLEHQGRVFARASLEDRLYADERPVSNALEALVSRLRKKLADAGVDDLVDTVRGLGYVVRPHVP